MKHEQGFEMLTEKEMCSVNGGYNGWKDWDGPGGKKGWGGPGGKKGWGGKNSFGGYGNTNWSSTWDKDYYYLAGNSANSCACGSNSLTTVGLNAHASITTVDIVEEVSCH
jgi:hypothetical protein